MSFIYIGTFGSFIGYSAAFPLLIKTQFPAVTIGIAFLGPLVGSLSRPFGGLLADKIGGAIITFWNFIAMAAATIGVLYFVGNKDFTGFLVMFLILFVTDRHRQRLDLPHDPLDLPRGKSAQGARQGRGRPALALKTASIESGAALGFIGAVGACGGYPDPERLRQIDRVHRRSAARADDLSRLLRDLPRHDLVVLPAPDAGRGGRDQSR